MEDYVIVHFYRSGRNERDGVRVPAVLHRPTCRFRDGLQVADGCVERSQDGWWRMYETQAEALEAAEAHRLSDPEYVAVRFAPEWCCPLR